MIAKWKRTGGSMRDMLKRMGEPSSVKAAKDKLDAARAKSSSNTTKVGSRDLKPGDSFTDWQGRKHEVARNAETEEGHVIHTAAGEKVRLGFDEKVQRHSEGGQAGKASAGDEKLKEAASERWGSLADHVESLHGQELKEAIDKVEKTYGSKSSESGADQDSPKASGEKSHRVTIKDESSGDKDKKAALREKLGFQAAHMSEYHQEEALNHQRAMDDEEPGSAAYKAHAQAREKHIAAQEVHEATDQGYGTPTVEANQASHDANKATRDAVASGEKTPKDKGSKSKDKEAKSMQTGPKGGRYYMSASGEKVYVNK